MKLSYLTIVKLLKKLLGAEPLHHQTMNKITPRIGAKAVEIVQGSCFTLQSMVRTLFSFIAD